ncbi:MAG: formylglycine-generating enzyme family protein, partial [Nitrospiria bacterium]
WLGPNYYQDSPKDNPKGPGRGEYHVLRGGSWGNNSLNVRVTFRTWLTVYERVNTFGFRIAAPASRQ